MEDTKSPDTQRLFTYQDSDSSERIEEADQHTQKLEDTVKASNRVLFRAKTVFPFDFFPDEIIIDESKVNLVHGLFFQSTQVFSIPFNNINGVTTSQGVFFGGLNIEVEGFNKNPPPLNKLLVRDAVKARRIINGLVTAYRQGIDMTKLNLNDMVDKIEAIGSAN